MSFRFVLLTFAIVGGGLLAPRSSHGQELICTFCEDCTNPLYGKTDQFNITGMAVELPFEIDCDFPYSCEQIPECEPGEEEEQAEILAFLEQSDVLGLKNFTERSKGRIELVPERNLVLYESACRKKVIGVFQVSEELFTLLE